MSVDKFGRRSHKRKAERGPKGEGFNLTAKGDYDMQGKRIRFLDDPVENEDAVNLKTLQTGLLKCMQLSSDGKEFDAQEKRIGNANDPVDQTDLVTKRYVDDKLPEKKEGFWSFKHNRLSQVAEPMYDGEAVNLAYLKKNTILKDPKSNRYDAKNSTVTNLAPPTNDSDAVNKAYLKNNVLLVNNDKTWDFKDKRLVNVSDPVGNDKDAINYGYLNRNAMCRVSDPNSDWDARWKKITYVSFPESDGDVITKGYLRHILGGLSYYIYSELKSRGGTKKVKLYPSEKWMTEVFSTPWKELWEK